MKNFSQLVPGQYYAPVFVRADFPANPEFFEKYNVGGYYKYLGGLDFIDDYGDIVDGFFDTSLQCYVAVDAPDWFVQ